MSALAYDSDFSSQLVPPQGSSQTLPQRFLHIGDIRALSKVAPPVERFDSKLKQLISDMYRIMRESHGVGLAAPQVGEAVRVAVINLRGRSLREESEHWRVEEEELEEQGVEEMLEDDCPEAREPFALVNPNIVRASEERRVYEEGCLSFPDVLAKMERPREVEVRYQNVDGRECFVKASGLLSVCLQHEIDHLEGRTIVHSLSRLKRSMVLRKLAKQAKQEGGRI